MYAYIQHYSYLLIICARAYILQMKIFNQFIHAAQCAIQICQSCDCSLLFRSVSGASGSTRTRRTWQGCGCGTARWSAPRTEFESRRGQAPRPAPPPTSPSRTQSCTTSPAPSSSIRSTVRSTTAPLWYLPLTFSSFFSLSLSLFTCQQVTRTHTFTLARDMI